MKLLICGYCNFAAFSVSAIVLKLWDIVSVPNNKKKIAKQLVPTRFMMKTNWIGHSQCQVVSDVKIIPNRDVSDIVRSLLTKHGDATVPGHILKLLLR